MSPITLQPAGWPRPRGYANGMMAEGRIVVTGGMIGWDAQERLVATDLVGQTAQALRNVVAVLAEAGAGPADVVRLTWYVTDLEAYRRSGKELGAVYRAVIGKSFPAMAVIGVAGLVEPGALVEIEAMAVLPPAQPR
jgi:enamine deaminase RidA (YjgF/YER057c/UK114 family)